MNRTGFLRRRSASRRGETGSALPAFWSRPVEDVLSALGTTPDGLREDEAEARIGRDDVLDSGRRVPDVWLLLRQFANPITLILIVATLLSAVLGDALDAAIILAIVLLSGLLGFWQERTASRAVADLLSAVQVMVTVRRVDAERDIPVREVVPGDIVILDTGDLVPADCLLLESEELLANEAVLTGESFPLEKQPGLLPSLSPIGERTNCLFMGTHITRGRATAVAVDVGGRTAFGQIAAQLERQPAPTRFERGLASVGRLLLWVMMLIVTVILTVNLIAGRPVLDSLLFALALAVGITPQLLPAVVSTSLSLGARQMARAKVIVKRLTAIEEFGGINLLCTDKTGTLTEGTVKLDQALDAGGNANDAVLEAAYINAAFQSDYANPIDSAIRAAADFDLHDVVRLDEAPYDFERRRLSVLVSRGSSSDMITKGALDAVLGVCSTVACSDQTIAPLESQHARIREQFAALSTKGYRVLGIARKAMGGQRAITAVDESDMTFLGFLLFFDPPKPGVEQALGDLARLGISLRLITGDNQFAARFIAGRVGLSTEHVLTGDEVRQIDPARLSQEIRDVTVFAEVDPAQKELIVQAFRGAGYDTAYLGDGINDAPALHAADVGISVDSAVTVAKDAASVVLLEKDLGVLMDGIRLGRRTFANTLKYIYVTISANFGNMVSMTIATLFLPFLPLLPFQILLINLLTDLPSMTIAADDVDPEQLERAGIWDVGAIRRFMLVFGLISTLFDLITFGVLRVLFDAGEEMFRSGWFLVSVATEIAVMLVLRTRRPFFRSRPSSALLVGSALIGVLALVIPFTAAAGVFGLVAVSPALLATLAGVLIGYILVTELAKSWFYRRPNVSER